MNVLYHALAALLVFAVFMRMTGAVWRSAFVAFLFALHPLHTESVAWMAERKDVLSALLWFLTVWAYLAYVKRPEWRRYAAVAGVFRSGADGEIHGGDAALALLLLDYWPLRRMDVGWGRLLLEKAPLLALSLGTGAVTYMAQQRSEYVMPLALISLSERVGNAWFPWWRTSAICSGRRGWPCSTVSVPCSGVAAAGGGSGDSGRLGPGRARRAAAPLPGGGWFWYLVTLIPVIGLVQVGSQARADRYTYIPMVGLTVAVAWGAAEFVKKRQA